MHKMRKIILIVFGLILSFNAASAQDEFPGGSPYSIFGIGDLKYNTSLRSLGMGVQGVGLLGNYINNMNPAANIFLDYTRFSFAVDYGFLKSANATSELKNSDGNVTGMNIGIPFSKTNGWVMNLGINPISIVNYKISQSGTQAGENYTKVYSGKGSISSLSLGMTYIGFKCIGLGAEYNYAFGNLKNQSSLNFSNPLITSSYVRNENDLRGSYFKAGGVFFLNNLTKSKNLKDLTFGAFYHSKIDLTSNIDAVYSTSIGLDTIRFTQGTFEIPSMMGFGVSNRFDNRYVIAADVLIQNWENFREFGISDPTYGTSMKYGLGFEMQPPDKADKTMWENLTYRFGVYYEKEYYNVNGQDIMKYGVSAGLGIPISDYNSIDVALNYSIRGKTDNGLVKDELFNVAVGLNFGELWFLRRAEE
jgi:hypothetical protein